LGVESIITNSRKEILSSDAAILPGVGAFGEAVNNFKQNDLIFPILDFINSGKPFMGICLGMQLLFTQSYEFGVHKGLNIFKGSVVRFKNETDTGERVKVPHVSWSQINQISESNRFWDTSLLQDICDGAYMYFVHSYYAVPEDNDTLLSASFYGGIEYCSGVKKENVEAFQFHPEKSGKEGLKILRTFKERIDKIS
jgi:glutamine amidotransferase